jgi:hypothetical protein
MMERDLNIVSLARARAERLAALRHQPLATTLPAAPDLVAIAAVPDFAERRRRLHDAITALTGSPPSARMLEHQMIATGLVAGHGCTTEGNGGIAWPLGSGLADPAVAVGLALHHLRHGVSRGMPMPRRVRAALVEHALRGNAAAMLVLRQLTAREAQARPPLGAAQDGEGSSVPGSNAR